MVAIGNDHELEDLRASEDAGAGASDGSEAKKPFNRSEAARDMLRAAEKSGNQERFFALDENPVLDNKPGKGTFWTNKNKKRAGIIGSILTGGSILTVFGFTSLAPLKIDSIVTRLEGVFGAGGDFATSRTLENMVNWYYTRDVLPGLQSGRCHSTISRNCVSLSSGDSLFDAWRKAIVQGHLESQLADKYGLEFGLKNGQYYMKTNVNGIAKTGTIPTEDFRAMLNGKVNIFQEGAKIGLVGEKGTQAEMRAAIREALKGASLADRVYFRLFIIPLLEQKIGLRWCMIACNAQDPFKDTIATKKLAAKALLIQQVIEPASKEYAFALQCVLAGGDLCSTDLKANAETGTIDGEKLSTYQEGLQTRLLEYVGDDAEKLAEIVKLTNEVSERGFANVVIEDVLRSIFPTVGEDIAKVGTKAIPVVGWVLLFAQVYVGAEKIGPALRVMGYAVTAAAAVQLYMMYRTVNAEMKSGHVDATEFGSFYQALSTNFSGSSNDQVDATDTPLYGALLGGGTDRSASNYRCNDGSKVPDGQLVCPEEKLDKGNSFFDGVSKLANSQPLLVFQANILNRINDLLGFIVGHGFEFTCNYLANSPIPQYRDGPGTCPYATKQLASLVGPISQAIINFLIPSPFSENMSGGRTSDMLAAGADVSYNKSCQVNLGCAKLTNQQVADVRNEMQADEKASFEGQPILARLFSTDNPYSLISQLAVAMPASVPAAANDMATAISSPMSTVSSLFSAMFGKSKVFAAQEPIDDPFGVVQYGYTADQIPDDPETYWNQHCQGDFRKSWFDAQNQDTNTGEPLATTPEPCMLIQTTIGASGTMFDASLAPNTTNP